MASVRDTVLAMLTQYPSLFTTKADCYRHLFLTNGNGYDWVDGELVSWGDPKTEPDFKDEDAVIVEHAEKYGIIPNHKKIFGKEEFEYVRLDTRRNNMNIQFALDNIDLIMRSEHVTFYSGSTILYSGWDYCPLMKVPADVKPDWLKAVNECRFALMSYIHQLKQIRHYITTGVDDLERDLKRLKIERFPEEFKRDADMVALTEEILAEIKAEENKD